MIVRGNHTLKTPRGETPKLDQFKSTSNPKIEVVTSTPRKVTEDASEFVQKLKEMRQEVTQLQKEKAELKEKLDQASMSTSSEYPSVSEFVSVLNKVKKDNAGLVENLNNSQSAIKDVRERIEALSLEKESFQPVNHEPMSHVAIVHCDLQGNANLWKLPLEKFRECLKYYFECVNEKALECGGYISPSQTDNIIVAFASIRKAIKFCLLVQMKLMEITWPKDLLESDQQPELYRGLRCRMGVDYGTSETIVDDSKRTRYVGEVVHRAAIITSHTVGGHVVISELAWTALSESKEKSDSPIRTVVQDLGPQELAGMEKKEHLRLIIPEQLKGRKFKGKQISVMFCESCMAIYLSNEISKLKSGQLENLKEELISLSLRVSNANTLLALCLDIADKEKLNEFERVVQEFRQGQKDINETMETFKRDYSDIKNKVIELESSVTKSISGLLVLAEQPISTPRNGDMVLSSKSSFVMTEPKIPVPQKESVKELVAPVVDKKMVSPKIAVEKIELEALNDNLNKIMDIVNEEIVNLEELLKQYDI